MFGLVCYEKLFSLNKNILQNFFKNDLSKQFLQIDLRWNLKNLSRGLNPPKSAKTRFKLSAGLNLETFDTILSGTNHIFKPPLKFFKFGLWLISLIRVKKSNANP